MFVLVASWLLPYGLVWTYGWASLSAVVVNGLVLLVMHRVGCRHGPCGV
jgi:hypothetical protein